MNNARIGKEIVLKVVNEIGVLNQVTKLIAERGVSILAVCGGTVDHMALLRLVTDDNLRTMDILRAHNYAPMEKDCVLVEGPHKGGFLSSITERVGLEDLDIHYLYATSGLSDDRCLVVFGCSHNERAVVALSRQLVEA